MDSIVETYDKTSDRSAYSAITNPKDKKKREQFISESSSDADAMIDYIIDKVKNEL